MIWFTLALFVVSFILTALLAPKPQFENARPDSLDPESFPRATENAPIPLILGKVRLEAPNTIWYGDFESVPIKETIRVSLFKKTRVTVGHNYYLGLDLALGMGPRTVLREIYCDDKLLWSGTTNLTTPTTINISQPTFFGGKKEGGGFSSTCTYYPGALDLTGNPVDTYLTGVLGAGNVPAYLGTAHIVFNKAYIGESAALRKMAFVLENYSNALGLPNNGKIGDDMNPAEAIYQIMTDTWRGMGIDPSLINVAQLQAIGTVLHSEGNGCSIIVTAESNGTQLIQEIFRQIDAIAYQDPDNGQINFLLIRNDYDVDLLPVYDESDVIKVTNFSRSGWDEVVAQVKITFPQRDRESDAVAISQDMATVAMIGRLRSTTISMPFVYDKDLANRIASRERAQLSVPLFRITLEMNRNAYSLRPGSVFKLDWPEYGFSGLVLRVQEFDLGSLLDGKIVVNCLQDSFSLSNTVFAAPADSTWVAPVTDPTPISNFVVVEMPKFFAQQIEFPISDGNAGYIPFAAKPAAASNAFDFAVGAVTGVLDSLDPEYADYVGSGVLTAVYLNTQGLLNGLDTTGSILLNGANGSLFSSNTLDTIRDGDGGLLYINGEWLGYTTATDLGGGAWSLTNIYRGLLGTRPLTHNIGTRVYAFSVDYLPRGAVEFAEGSTVFYKFLDRAGRKAQDISEVSQSTVVLNANRQNRPLRPSFLQIAGARVGIIIEDTLNKNLTWNARNRLVTQIAIENDATQTPDITETYDIDVMVNGVRNATLSGTGVTSPYTIPFSSTLIDQVNCEIRAFSRRTTGDTRSSETYAWLPFSMNQSIGATLGINPADMGTNILLSDSNKVMTKTVANAWVSGRSFVSKTTGKWYLEVDYIEFSASFIAAGFGISTSNLASYAGSQTSSIGLVSDGNYYSNGAATAVLPAISEGSVICFALDLDNDKIWFRNGAGAWNSVIGGAQDPAANTGGVTLNAAITGSVFFMGSVQRIGDQLKLRQSAGQFVHAPPSGFSPFVS